MTFSMHWKGSQLIMTSSRNERSVGLSLRDKVRSLDSWRELGAELLLLGIERNQLRWFEDINRMPPLEMFQQYPSGWRPQGRTSSNWKDCMYQLARERLGVPQE